MSDTPDAGPASHDDERLVGELASALGPDAPPEGMVDRCGGLVAWMDVDHELAALLESPELEAAGTRGTTSPAPEHVFELSDASVALQVVIDGDRLNGQVLAGAPTEVALERVHGGVDTATVDRLGRFSFASVPAGPARLRLLGDLGVSVTSDWFLV